MRAFAERLTSAMRFIVDQIHHEEEIHVKTFMANAQTVERKALADTVLEVISSL